MATRKMKYVDDERSSHTKAGLAIPDFLLAFGRVVPPIESFPVAVHFAHRLGALAVTACVLGCAVQAYRSGRPGLKKMALSLAGILAVQITLGAVTVLSRKAVPVTTAHVVTGALLLGMALTFTLCSRRQMRSSDSRAVRGSLARKEAVA